MIDTHTHIYFPDFEEGIDGIMELCSTTGVTHLILPNVDETTLPQMKELHERYPDLTSMAIGIHPTEVKEDWKEKMEIVERELSTGNYVAVGEVGMDLYWDKSFVIQQKDAFEKQLQYAEKLNLPVIIHCRDAFDETLEVIEKVNPSVPLIFHSFTGDIETVRNIRKVCDPWFGINGVVTYKNAPKLREALQEIGIEKIVLETDSPYLSPVPHRGKPNNSSYIIHVRDQIAESLGMTREEVESITDVNARKIFKI